MAGAFLMWIEVDQKGVRKTNASLVNISCTHAVHFYHHQQIYLLCETHMCDFFRMFVAMTRL